MAEDEAEILVQRGLVLQWQGPSMYESQDDLNARDAAGISPGRETKTLRLLRQLGPQTIDGPVWLCETLDGQGRAVHVVLKLFSPTLWAKPDLEYYVSHAWTAEVLWRRIPGPEYVRRTNMPVLNVLSSLSSRTAMYRENTAYARLKHMQGDAIPISYGFYRFLFPPNTLTNPVFAHVSEYIDGTDPHELIWDLAEEHGPGDIHIEKILGSIFALYKRIHAAGVAHQDIACRNLRIIWDREAGTVPRVVIFDFDSVKFGRDHGSIFRREETTLSSFLMELGAWQSGAAVTKWLEEGEGKLLYRNFGNDLLNDEGLRRRTEELAVREASLALGHDEEADKAWKALYGL